MPTETARINALITEAHTLQQTLENVPPSHRTHEWTIDYVMVLQYVADLNRTKNNINQALLIPPNVPKHKFTVLQGGLR